MIDVVAAMCAQHRRELAEAQALVVLYRAALEDAGVEVPCESGAEALDRYREAVVAAGIPDHREMVEAWTVAA